MGQFSMEISGQAGSLLSGNQQLASRHHLGLRYPARMLIAALCYRLLGLDLSVAARKTWNNPSSFPLANDVADEIEQQYLADLQETPKLLPGVCTGLERLHRANAILILVTEGGRSRVQKLLRANKIDGYIDRVIDAPKRKELFARIKRLFDTATQVYMIGDQITRDIQPATEAGLRAIHVQGKFRPVWDVSGAVSKTREANTFDDAANSIIADICFSTSNLFSTLDPGSP